MIRGGLRVYGHVHYLALSAAFPVPLFFLPPFVTSNFFFHCNRHVWLRPKIVKEELIINRLEGRWGGLFS
jgi:hypothetical protein